jgi:hypothetical protein
MLARVSASASVGLFLLAGCTSAPAPGELYGSAEQPIVNGELHSGDPAVVYIDVGCSGTLVSPRVVLTACHCLEGAGSQPEVFFGSNINQSGTWINAIHHQIYPGACVGDGDLAMITLGEAGPTAPIPVNGDDLAGRIGEPVRLVGFGVVGEGQSGSGVKRLGTTVLQDLEPGLMWTGGQVSGICYGDSGGPQFMDIDGAEHVAGVNSFVSGGCGNPGNDGAARTDTYIQWIRQYIDDHDPATCEADLRCAENCGAVDPDCPCAGDGFCTDACADLGSDPDCAGCGVGDTCREDCPVLDSDCCAADGTCFELCAAADPDCDAPPDPEDPADPLPPDGDGDGHQHDEAEDDDGDGGLYGSVACAYAPAPATRAGWLSLALAALMIARRRKHAR